MNIYKNKYIKYKQKYIQLKQKAGSGPDKKVPPSKDGKTPPPGDGKKPYPEDSPFTFFMNDDTDLKKIINTLKLSQFKRLLMFKTVENLRYKLLNEEGFMKFMNSKGELYIKFGRGHIARLKRAIKTYFY